MLVEQRCQTRFGLMFKRATLYFISNAWILNSATNSACTSLDHTQHQHTIEIIKETNFSVLGS